LSPKDKIEFRALTATIQRAKKFDQSLRTQSDSALAPLSGPAELKLRNGYSTFA